MSDTTATPETTDTELTPNDRRALLRKIAIGGAGAAAGAVMLSNGRCPPHDGDDLVLGNLLQITARHTDVPRVQRRIGRADRVQPAQCWRGPPQCDGRQQCLPRRSRRLRQGAMCRADCTDRRSMLRASASSQPIWPRTRTRARHRRRRRSPSPHPVHTSSSFPERRPVRPTARMSPVSCTSTREGTLWFTVPAPTATDDDAVRFVKLAGTPTTGSFHAINPQRVYDSRQPGYPTALQGLMAPNTNRVISVADGRQRQRHRHAGQRRTGRSNSCADQPHRRQHAPARTSCRDRRQCDDDGNLGAQLERRRCADRERTDGSAQPELVRLRVYCGDQTGSTHVIVDVFGYYL
jgi:hypothetical protein